MHFMKIRSICIFFILLVCSVHSEEAAVSKEKPLQDETVKTSHKVTIGNTAIEYTATAGTLILKDSKDVPQASMFYIAYERQGTKSSSRPIVFCFNGGPGSSSVWLNTGAFGPKRVAANEEGTAILYPAHLIDNSESILDVADLVFIDPVSTGYSRAAPGVDEKTYHQVEKDVKSVADFIRLYLTRNGRWESPKYIAGESYGTLRAGRLVDNLFNDHRITLDGVILISSVLNYQTMKFGDLNDLPYEMYLPAYTAAAFYHKKLAGEMQKNLEDTLKQVEEFVLDEYTVALMKGDDLPAEKRKEIVKKLAAFTGMDEDYIERADLRIYLYRFCKELLRKNNLQIGRFDSRITGYSSDLCADSITADPSFDQLFGPFTSTYNQYLREDLGWKTDAEYLILAKVWPWDYSVATNEYLDATTTLREIMLKVPTMRVFVASGYYDLALPYMGTKYTFSHLGLDPKLRSNVQLKFYESGHMMYLQKASLVKMKSELAEFIAH